MSDDNTAAGAASEGGAAPEVEKPPAAAPVVDDALGGAGGDGGNNDAEASSQSWREDWRESLSGGDDAFLRSLKRFASPENFAKSYKGLQQKLTRGEVLPILAEDATPEEITAYRKAAGVPETPDSYDYQFPAEAGSVEHSKAVLDGFKAFMHENHIGANDRGARKAFEFYSKAMVQGQAARNEAMEEAREQNIAELRGAWPGREFTRNTRLAEEFMKGEGAFAHFEEPLFDESAAKLIRNAHVDLGDGKQVELRLYAPFVKGMVNLARKLADAEALIGGDGAGGGKSLDAERQELLAKPYGARTPAERQRLDEIYAKSYPETPQLGPRRGRAA